MTFRCERLLWLWILQIQKFSFVKILLVINRANSYNHKFSCFFEPAGCSAAWLARVPWEHEVASSNLATPTIPLLQQRSRRLYVTLVIPWMVFFCLFHLLKREQECCH